MKNHKGTSILILLFLLVPVLGTLVSAELDVGYTLNAPRVVLGTSSLSCSDCGSNNTYVNQTIINQYFNDTIWTNDSDMIFIRPTFNQTIDIVDRRTVLSGTINSTTNYFVGTNPFSRSAFQVLSLAILLSPPINSNSKFILQSISGRIIDAGGNASITEVIGTEYNIGGFAVSNSGQNIGNLTSITIRPTLGTAYQGNLTKVSGITISGIIGSNGSGSSIGSEIALEILDINRSGVDNYAVKSGLGKWRIGDSINVSGNVTASYFIGNGTFLTGVCHSASDPGCGGSGNPFDQVLNATSTVVFNNLTVNSSGGIPLFIRRNTNSSVDTTDFIRIQDNQSYSVFRLYGYGRMDISAPSNSRTMIFDPINGAFDMSGSSLHINRFSTSSNAVIGATGSGGVSASLLIGNGVGNTNFGSEAAKLFVGVVGNNTRLIAAKGGLGQTRSAYSVLNFSDYEVFNVSNRGEVLAKNISIVENYKSSDGSIGITNTTGFWMCTDSLCVTTCQVSIKNGLITGCV